MTVNFNPEHFYKLRRKEGHLLVTLQALYENSPAMGEEVNFILDTGAYLTVLNRGTAITCGYDKLPKKTTYIRGYSGKEPADLVYIQGLKILGKVMTHVAVLIPHSLYSADPETGEKRQFQEVLGLNVLEYFNYFIDTENDMLHMKWNPTPKPYSKALACGEIYTVQPD